MREKTNIYIYTHTYTCTYTHIHTHTYTHTYTVHGSGNQIIKSMSTTAIFSLKYVKE